MGAGAVAVRSSGKGADDPMQHVTFDTHPDSYRHWRLDLDGPVATLTLDVDEDAGLAPGYKLKLNSYDLGVDIELHDALQRLRFEHPEVRSVVLTGGKERIFCSGANIYMLGTSSHAWKVNFCKFTNETRNGIEDSSRHSGLKFLAAVNGVCAGGGYELALACDEIVLVDDRSSVVSLPEVPLLGVLPGTGGLTRLVDKRRVRRDLADLFCTNADGVKGQRAVDWGLVDAAVPPARMAAHVRERALALAAQSDRPEGEAGVTLTPLNRRIDESGYHYDWVEVALDAAQRVARITIRVPDEPQPETLAEIKAAGAAWWPLAMARELDDALLLLRHNQPELGTLVFASRGDVEAALRIDRSLATLADDWFVRETVNLLRRTLARVDVSSRSLFALIDEGSCFAGTLFELALAADRSYMLDLPSDLGPPPAVALSPMNFGPLAMVNGLTRLATRFHEDEARLSALKQQLGLRLEPARALELGLITLAPDELDWEDEVRLALEERAGLSPDALTGMEASLRFPGRETQDTRIFGRLSAWQNWIFNRPNAVGESGALKIFGSGRKAKFNWERV